MSSPTFNRGRWQKGQSGNPAGRGGIPRTLADRLRVTAEKPGYFEYPNKNVMARYVWDAVVKGRVELVNGRRIELSDKEWIDLVKWVNVHVDGSLHIQRSLLGEDGLPDAPTEPDPSTDPEANEFYYMEKMKDDPKDDQHSLPVDYFLEEERDPHQS